MKKDKKPDYIEQFFEAIMTIIIGVAVTVYTIIWLFGPLIEQLHK